jgi:hypothetical protein
VLLLVAGAAAQEACRFCPLDPAVAAPACSTSVSGCTGSRRAASDAEADAIKHCTVISGTLTIQSFSLTATGLAKLSNLERVCGDVAIQQLRVGGALTGLDSLEYVGGNFTIEENAWDSFNSADYLSSLAALSSLRYVGGALKVTKNYHLESLADTVLQFEHAVIGDPGASVVDYYVGGSDCAGDCALPGTPACGTCSATSYELEMCEASNANCEPYPWAPTPRPTSTPTPRPTPQPTFTPTPKPTPMPTPSPSPRPTPQPTPAPSPAPGEPTEAPVFAPTPRPTPDPTSKPTAVPSPGPTQVPVPAPTDAPTICFGCSLVEARGCSTSVSSCSGTYTIQTDTNADDRKHCTVIGGTLSIQGGAGLTASGLDKLSGLERVCGAVSIQNLPLTDLAWLNALEFVGGDLTIENNANDLDTLEALDNLLYIGGKLIVRENWLLDSVDEIMPYFQYALLGNWDNSIVKYYPSCTDGSCAVAYDVAAGLCASSHTECASNPFATAPAPTVAPTPGPTLRPTPAPSVTPTPGPSPRPTPVPTPLPGAPTKAPVFAPTPRPTPQPTKSPTPRPTPVPTGCFGCPLVEERPCGSAAPASGDCARPWSIQNDDDAQSFLDAGCTIIGGPLTIQGTGSSPLTATGLAKLSNLKRVCGDLAIQQLSVPDLTGLDNLEFVEANLIIQQNAWGSSTSADYLTSLAALSKLLYVGGLVKIEENYHLESFDASVEHFQYAIVGTPAGSSVNFYAGGNSCAGDCALPGTPACTTCAPTAVDVVGGACASSHTGCTSNPFSSAAAPSPGPTPAPSPRPTSSPSSRPTPSPSVRPTPTPTPSPTTPAPSPGPGGPTSPPTTSRPSPVPSLRPTHLPTRSPTPSPTPSCTCVSIDPRTPDWWCANVNCAPVYSDFCATSCVGPTPRPTTAPQPQPTPRPTPAPSPRPTLRPTPSPSAEPTPAPSNRPSHVPTRSPTPLPSTNVPIPAPTPRPMTPYPTPEDGNPTAAPVVAPIMVLGTVEFAGISVRTLADHSEMFEIAIADVAGVNEQAVNIVSIDAVPSGRRRLSTGISVGFEIQTTTPAGSATVQSNLAAAAADPSVMDTAVAATFTMSTVTTLGLSSWPAPTPAPTPRPTPFPTVFQGNPTARPVTPHPTPLPTPHPTPVPSQRPTPMPTLSPTPRPTQEPSAAPTVAPTLTPCWKLQEACEQDDDGVCELGAPPELASASFSTTGAELYVTFTNATDQGGRDQGESFVCSEVLTFPDASATTCYFATASQIVADASAAPGLDGGTNVVLPYGKLRKACDWERCECDFYNPGGQASAAVPSGVQQPVAMLQGPQEAAAQSCDGTEVSAAPSTGHLGRPFESYVWEAVADATDNTALAAIQAAVNRATSVFDLTGDDLSVVGAYVDVRVDVSNWLGATDTSDWFRIRVTAGLPPSVEIVGGISQTYRRMDAVSVMAQGIATACDGRGLIKRAVNYTWALTPGGLETTSHDERFYKLPPYSLDVGPYILTVAVTDSFTGDVSTATTALTVEPGDITAEIAGGDAQIAMAGTITLDASASRDLDVPAGEPSGLAFSWDVDGTTYAGETVDVTLGAGTYIVTLTVTKDQRSATATATFELTSSNPPVVDVDASAYASRRVAAQGGVVLYGAVAPGGGGGGLLNSSWSARTTETAWLAGVNLAEGLDLDAYAETAIALASTGSTGAYQHNLVIAPGALVDGATYVFELSATFDGVPGAASVQLVAVSAPTAGSCSVVPTNGSLTSTQFVALETKFVVSTSSWAAVDLPLSYAFRAAHGNGVVSTLAPFALRATVEDVYLPVGDVRVSCVARDALGGEGAATVDVTLVQTSMAGAALRNYTRWAFDVAFALARPEQALQVAVSGAPRAAETIDAKHTTQLVDAITAVVGNLDAEKALVEAAAVASGVATGAALTTYSANASLHAVAAMARLSAPLGVTAAAADGLVGALSNVLGVTANVTDEVFGAALDDVGAALVTDAVEGERPSCVVMPLVSISARAVAANATGLVAAANSSVEIDPLGDAYDVVVAELAEDPLGAGAAPTSRVVRVGAFSAEGRRRLSADRIKTSVVIDANKEAEAVFARNDSAIESTLTCDCGFVGNATTTCPDGSIIALPCDGLPTTIDVSCAADRTTCTTARDGAWTIDESCVTSASATETLCECEAPIDEPRYYSTASNARTLIGSYVANLTEEPDFRRAAYVLYALLALLVCCVGGTLLGRRLDARDSKLAREDAFDGLEAKLSDDRATGRFEDLLRPSLARAATGLRVQHPFVNFWCVYSPGVPRAARAWVCGFEVLAFLFGAAVASCAEINHCVPSDATIKRAGKF